MISLRGYVSLLCFFQLVHTSRCLRYSTSSKSWAKPPARCSKMRAVSAQTAAGASNEVEKGDVVTVVGCTGNVGRLVTSRLASMGTFRVRGLCRSKEKGEACFDPQLRAEDGSGLGGVRLFEGNTWTPDPGLEEALKGANAVIVTTGTTAFPTKSWAGGNTPENVDNVGVKNVIDTWIAANPAGGEGSAKLKRFILMSSVGVTRRAKFPFLILNIAGVLDAKAAAEDHLMEAASDHNFDYTIVRPGQLFGGPYDNNYYVGTLLKLDKDANTQSVTMETGDRLAGDTLRSTTAEAIAIALQVPEARNTDFTVLNTKGPSTSEEEFRELFSSPSFFAE